MKDAGDSDAEDDAGNTLWDDLDGDMKTQRAIDIQTALKRVLEDKSVNTSDKKYNSYESKLKSMINAKVSAIKDAYKKTAEDNNKSDKEKIDSDYDSAK